MLKSWHELTRIQKIIVGLVIIALAILSPEIALMLDLSGIDFVFFLLLVYGQNIKNWLNLHFGVISYPLIETKTYVKSVSLSTVLFFVTSSFVFSSVFFLLMLFLKK